MNVAFDKPSLWQRARPIFGGFDLPLACAVLFLVALAMVNMYSVGFDHGTRFFTHGRNILLALGVMFLVAQVPPQRLMVLAVAAGSGESCSAVAHVVVRAGTGGRNRASRSPTRCALC